MDNLIISDHEQPEDDDDEPAMTQLTNAIKNVTAMIHRNSQKKKLLQTQVPPSKDKKSITMSSNT